MPRASFVNFDNYFYRPVASLQLAVTRLLKQNHRWALSFLLPKAQGGRWRAGVRGRQGEAYPRRQRGQCLRLTAC